MQTEFGILTIPNSQLHSFRPGLKSRPELQRQISTLVESLVAHETSSRDRASRALQRLGPAVIGPLRQSLVGDEGERDRRIMVLLERLESDAADFEFENSPGNLRPWIQDDTIRTNEFTIVGKIITTQFTLQSRFGEMKIELADIDRASCNASSELQDELLAMTVDGKNLASLKFKSSGMQVKKGRSDPCAGKRQHLSQWQQLTGFGPRRVKPPWNVCL